MYLLLYGSQTGQAKSIAEDVYENLKLFNVDIQMYELDEIDKKYSLDKIDLCIVICSTTGDGDAPENASKFLRTIKHYAKNSLDFLYTVLGLGDTNYSHFCNCGKSIDVILSSLGGHRFYSSGWADDAVGLEIVVEPWLDGLYSTLKDLSITSLTRQLQIFKVMENVLPVNNVSNKCLIGDEICDDLRQKELNVPVLPQPVLSIEYLQNTVTKCDYSVPLVSLSPLPANVTGLSLGRVQSTERITQKFAVKPVHRMTVNIGCSDGWKWNPGDTVGVLPMNSPEEVDAVLNRLNLTNDQKDSIVILKALTNENKRAKVPEHLSMAADVTLTLRRIFLWLVDIRMPLSKVGLRIMSNYCPPGGQEERRILELCSKEGQAFYTKCIRQSNMPLLDLLNWFPSCAIPVERLLEVLPRLKPRAYSLCHLDDISFAYSKVDIAPIQQFRKRPLTGVCTSWMTSLTADSLSIIPIYLRKNLNGFTVTDITVNRPHILIGPGTGVAPFISFLQFFERMKNEGKEIGKVWLFFGCRNEEKDFIFKEELLHFLNEGVLSHYCVCFSRDISHANEANRYCQPAECKYVQHCLIHHAKELTLMLVNEDAKVFVCGDATGMAKDVQTAWVDVLTGNHSSIPTKKDAESFITKMRVNKQYLEDVWI